MAKIITSNATLDMAKAYHSSGYCYYNSNGDADDTYTVFFEGPPHRELYSFGHKFCENDDLNGVKNAWIAPDGSTYYVFWHGHSAFAHANHHCTVDELENDGWCHFSYGSVANVWHTFNKKQRESIAYLYMYNGDDRAAQKYFD